ncbi:MAG: ABC transporter permease subunit [Synergistetes bacterium]|nr:ABC transporter permease subunit [Synergistota bacterium]MDW8191727.1 ABC transporter permease subunit [Synergistota bacterium]
MGERKYLLLFLIPLIAIIVLFLFIPLAFVLRDSLLVEGRLSLSNYYAIFTKRLYINSFKTSLALSLATTAIGTSLGIPLSYLIYKKGSFARDMLLSLNSIPLVFSGLVVGFSFIVLLGGSGFITLLFKMLFGINPIEFSAFLFTWKGLMIAYLYFLIPRMVLTMIAAWSTFNWNLLDAAISLGASYSFAFRKVILPLIAPSVIAGSSLLFAVSMGAFGTAFALTGTGVNIVPLLIYTHISEVGIELGRADALAVILTLLTTSIIVVYERLFIRRIRRT